MLFQNPPAAFHRMVFAVIGRVIQQRNGFADVIGKRDHAVEKPSAPPMAFREIVGLDLGQSDALTGVWGLLLPTDLKAAECPPLGSHHFRGGAFEILAMTGIKNGCLRLREYDDPRVASEQGTTIARNGICFFVNHLRRQSGTNSSDSLRPPWTPIWTVPFSLGNWSRMTFRSVNSKV